ncbi:MAG: glycosyltransferase family 2 protein [Gemmobacter sp.]|uniref:glycosyltransferase family 2 protein n=1 Tax=Gemmobacter sp. TaxID=1898957 RepID=UPI001A5A0412|nr:glycosyltransferase family 2 protein [Gemmobacter sp.]MBL8564032.1 glycosyltransferase family 2 protein [Gemmobacter sp.]
MAETYTVLTTMKNEGAFLLEWFAHHKALGFDRFLICTNDCEDPTTDMVVRLSKMGLAIHHKTLYRPTQSIQRRALKQGARYREVKSSDWIYVCDADEFLASHIGDGSVRALTAAGSDGVEAISVPWRRFGTNGQKDYREGLITQQFPMANAASGPRAYPFAFPKSLFRGELLREKMISRVGVHVPLPRPELGHALRVELPGGVPVQEAHQKLLVQADYSRAQVNHYQLRSMDSFLVKSARGKVNHVNDKMGYRYWAFNDTNEERCDLIRRYDAEVARWMEELLSDRRLNTLHHRAVRWHRSKVAELHASPDFAEMITQIEAHRSRMSSEEAAPAEAMAAYQGDLDVPDAADDPEEDAPAATEAPHRAKAAKKAAKTAKTKAAPAALALSGAETAAALPAAKPPRKAGRSASKAALA